MGAELGRQLVLDGHTVWGLRRSSATLPDGIRRIVGDVTRPETFEELPGELDAVVYAVSADGFDEDSYRRAYVDGPANLVAALGGAPRFLLVSSTGVYGQTGGEWVDERSRLEPQGFSGRILLEAEGQVLADRGSSVVRLAGLYGPGRVLLMDRVRAGEATCTDDPQQYLNLIHRDDAAGLIRHLLMLSDPPPVLIGADDEPVDRCVILRWIAERIGAPPPRVTAPDPATGPRRRSNKRCSNRLLRSIDYRLRYPTWRDGYEALLNADA